MTSTTDLPFPPSAMPAAFGSDHNMSTPSPSSPDATPRSDLLSRVVQSAHHTIDRLAETAAPHVQKLQDGMSSAGEAVSDRTAQAREVGDEWTESLRTTVREHPIAAVAAALAVGMLFVKITR